MGIDSSSSVVDGRFCRYLLRILSRPVGSVVCRRISVRDVLRDESRCSWPLKLSRLHLVTPLDSLQFRSRLKFGDLVVNLFHTFKYSCKRWAHHVSRCEID